MNLDLRLYQRVLITSQIILLYFQRGVVQKGVVESYVYNLSTIAIDVLSKSSYFPLVQVMTKYIV